MTTDFELFKCTDGDEAALVPADPAADPDSADAQFFLEGTLPAFDFWERTTLCEEAGPANIELFFGSRELLPAMFPEFVLSRAAERVFLAPRLLCALKELELLGRHKSAEAVPMEERRALVRAEDEILSRLTRVEHAVRWSLGKHCIIADPKLAPAFADDLGWALLTTEEFLGLFTPWAIYVSLNDFPPVPPLEAWHAHFPPAPDAGRGRRTGWIVTLDWFRGAYSLSAVRVEGGFDPETSAAVSLPLLKGMELEASVDRRWFSQPDRWAERKRLEMELRGLGPAAFDDWVRSRAGRQECEAACERENRLLAEFVREALPVLVAAIKEKGRVRSFLWNPDTGEIPPAGTGFEPRPAVPDVDAMRALALDPVFRVHLLGDVRVPGGEGAGS